MSLPLSPAPALEEGFVLEGPEHRLNLAPEGMALPRGPISTLAGRADAFFAAQGGAGLRLAGAVPYRRDADDYLFAARLVPRDLQPKAALPARVQRLIADPPAASYRAAVALALKRIAAGEFDKIVLSRCLRLQAGQSFDPAALYAALGGDASITRFAVPLPPRRRGIPRHLIGATPELLIAKQGDQIRSHPLAGTARRAPDPAADRAAGEALMRSDKDRREHALAAEMVLDTLAPFCRTLGAPQGVALTQTAGLWHLGTRIEGQLKDRDLSCASLLAALHPTPAVSGWPLAEAEAALPGLEGYERDFYAGAVGWLEPGGDGAWYLALRCAEVEGQEARLYAGAGVVAGSDPAGEEAETEAKFHAMLAGFGLAPGLES